MLFDLKTEKYVNVFLIKTPLLVVLSRQWQIVWVELGPRMDYGPNHRVVPDLKVPQSPEWNL